ncbi:MAG: phenazine biosynthesis protein [Alteromonadaceae bacterium]|nr:phenazine biosynthesis protein [Alteromonadaceae bacterium]MBH86854.1 phenazine biosynthesis protein [Alteromonadaceae bacterium]|tara:strand:- start:6381 stop:7286 length:906 start_codon:yes stop_codon:yes gene_type:complete
MALDYSLLDVFADAPFQGTQIPVVDGRNGLSDDDKLSIAGEFQQTETVFVDADDQGKSAVSVYNAKGKTLFGAHTILAASYVATEMGLVTDRGSYLSFDIAQNDQLIHSFIDKSDTAPGTIQFSRILTPTVDRYTPDVSRIAKALSVDEKHITFSKYKPLMVSVDQPTLVVPFTKAQHVLDASLHAEHWKELMSEIYATHLLLFAPGSITGSSDFHGRLVSPDLARDVFPPIGNVMPEFIAYLAEQQHTAEGTHTFSIDRGSLNTRKSVLHVEFDKHASREVACRIGGNVIKMGTGSLLVS